MSLDAELAGVVHEELFAAKLAGVRVCVRACVCVCECVCVGVCVYECIYGEQRHYMSPRPFFTLPFLK